MTELLGEGTRSSQTVEDEKARLKRESARLQAMVDLAQGKRKKNKVAQLLEALKDPPPDQVEKVVHPKHTMLHFVKFYVLYVPIATAIVAGILGLILAEIEGWNLQSGILYMVSLACHITNPLNDDTPSSTLGVIYVLIISAWAVCYIGVLIAAALEVKWPRQFVHHIEARFGAGPVGPLWRRVGVFLLVAGIIVPAVLFTLAVFAALILAWVENWPVRTAIKYVVQNVAHLPPPDPLTSESPESFTGKIADAAISLVVLSLTLLMYTVAAWPVLVDQTADLLDEFALRFPNPALGFTFIAFAIVPVALVVFILILGAVLSQGEGWSLHLGVIYAASLVSQQVLTDVRPESPFGVFFVSIAGMWALAALGTLIGMVATLEYLDIWAKGLKKRAKTVFGLGDHGDSCAVVSSSAGIFGILIVPAACITFGAVFGGILSFVEGWPFIDGFLYILTNVFVLPGPLTEVLPKSLIGTWMAVVVSIWGLVLILSIFMVITLIEDDDPFEHGHKERSTSQGTTTCDEPISADAAERGSGI
eukprot:CAMPEP_0172607464 /NCGR_PEP_ID=MMETSP1068-20121228/27648_1 /TAXON_ID=35684 /ORGANISM="Pseudopedinella elastica, Strain CCMP716" /LENGTH=533 /DNA_ID=CAMNT_0013410483 /DNA_START=33 /DNA_END=1634 /DNA_ORIENTATION=+